MFRNSAAELRLLVEISHECAPRGPTLIVNGRRWGLTIFSNVTERVVHLDYVCVSYVWGSQRVLNPFEAAPQLISSNTLPALSAAMCNVDSKAFWIDAFCIPTTQPARRATLESMGCIYSQAKEVRVALSKHSFSAFQQLSTEDGLDEAGLSTLEQDKWVESVWTYQEVVNSQRLSFVCPESPGALVDGSHCLNGVDYTLGRYKKNNNFDAFDMRERFPRLDALEDLIADWMTADYNKRAALAVMSNMDRRVWTDERNYFFAMIGAVTDSPFPRSQIQDAHLSKTFMAICEAKNDFSFIYSSSLRAEDPDRRWQPREGLLPSVLSWHSSGEAQRGHFDQESFFWLDDVLQLRRSALHHDGKRHIATWLHQEGLTQADENTLAERVHATLVRMGFTGSKDYMSLRDGLFFPQTSLPSEADISVLVSVTIRWTLGAPGLACTRGGVQAYIPGVFAGRVDPAAACSVQLT